MGTATTDRPPLDFAERMRGVIDDGGLALLMSIGHRTGLFDVMAGRPPSTAAEIAEAADLSEEPVREWLRGMAGGGIVARDPSSGAYELPTEHATHLSRMAVRANLAALAEHVPLLGAEEDRIVERFHRARRTPYAASPSFRHVISKGTQESDEAVVRALVDSILSPVPGLLEALRSGINGLDIHCGSGRAVNLTASIFPRSSFRGYDPHPRHVESASWRAFELGLTNVQFEMREAADLDEPARYDLITDFDALRHHARPKQVLQNVVRALRPGGTLLMQEISASSRDADDLSLPEDSPLRSAHSLAAAGQGTELLKSEQQLRNLLLEIGFERVVMHRLPHHIYNCYFIATKGRTSP